MGNGTKTQKKTKKEIEADHPFIKPEDCPGAVINWVVKRDVERDKKDAERDTALVKLIEQTIDKLFEKHFRKYITMIFTNRILSILALVGLTILWGIVLYHIYR